MRLDELMFTIPQCIAVKGSQNWLEGNFYAIRQFFHSRGIPAFAENERNSDAYEKHIYGEHCRTSGKSCHRFCPRRAARTWRRSTRQRDATERTWFRSFATAGPRSRWCATRAIKIPRSKRRKRAAA